VSYLLLEDGFKLLLDGQSGALLLDGDEPLEGKWTDVVQIIGRRMRAEFYKADRIELTCNRNRVEAK
jgi:hypothetical protein